MFAGQLALFILVATHPVELGRTGLCEENATGVYWIVPTNRVEERFPWYRVEEVLKGPPLAEFHPRLTFEKDRRCNQLPAYLTPRPTLMFVFEDRACSHECEAVSSDCDYIINPHAGMLPAEESERTCGKPPLTRRKFIKTLFAVRKKPTAEKIAALIEDPDLAMRRLGMFLTTALLQGPSRQDDKAIEIVASALIRQIPKEPLGPNPDVRGLFNGLLYALASRPLHEHRDHGTPLPGWWTEAIRMNLGLLESDPSVAQFLCDQLSEAGHQLRCSSPYTATKQPNDQLRHPDPDDLARIRQLFAVPAPAQ